MSKSVLLSSAVVGEGSALILLHGLFGMGDNLSMVARALSDKFQVHRLDLRNHGRSPRADSMTFADMAADIVAYMDNNSIAQAHLLGHSLGGKVAMEVALAYPQRVNKLVVADIAPVAYSGHHDTVFAGLNAVDLDSVSSRKEAELILKQYIEEDGVCSFILKSLYRNQQGQFDWRMNVSVLQRCYSDLRQRLLPERAFKRPVLFIKGELSNYIQVQHQDVIMGLFPNAQFKIIQNTGHWLHAEKPVAFNNVVRKFLIAEG